MQTKFPIRFVRAKRAVCSYSTAPQNRTSELIKVRYTSSLLRLVPDTYVNVVAVHEKLPCTILALVERCRPRTEISRLFLRKNV